MSALPFSLLARIGLFRNFRPLDRPGSQRVLPLAWLLSPSPSALRFAVCSTIAALLSLVIAMWMELDDPQWAPMTVWIVAQGSRGESLSKARWRLVGTMGGVVMSITVISAFNQQPWLFFPALALWMGGCCMLATLVRNFRSYSLVLAGYTTAIIATAAIPHPENIFMIAMSRATYIVLGIVCESTVAGLFAPNLAATARRNMRDKLRTALSGVSESVASLLSGDNEALVRSRAMFAPLLSINDQIEFSEVEMGPHGHEGDHARAALAAVSVLLSRGLGMAVRLHYVQTDQPVFRETAAKVSEFLTSLPKSLNSDIHVHELLRGLQLLRAECHQKIVDALTQEIGNAFDITADHDQIPAMLDGRILHNALDELLGELEQAIREYDASQHFIRGDHFRFRLQSHTDQREACYNGVRAMVAITASGLIWECTAWSDGLPFITFVAMVCGLFATRENPVVATTQFMVGGLWAAVVAFVLVFLILPTQADYEILVATLALPMIAGGLAARNAGTALHSAAYTLLLPNFVHPLNQGRVNEVAWFNSTIAILLGVFFAVLIFRAVLPFSSGAERWRMRRAILRDLRTLASADPVPLTQDWIARNIDRFSRLIRHAGPTPSPTIEGCLQGTLAAMTIGLNVIRLRTLLQRNQIPPGSRRALEIVMTRMSHFTGRYGHTAHAARVATSILRRQEASEPNIATRIELTRAITYLIVVSHELDANAVFLDASKPFKAT
ncbi:FUSC family protein [Acetobacter vaccinii]|uniref:FUSC family protein n=1 Tax=Acetobacter vaccinii TaxID=2592655 RepID=A0A5C1YLX3_9PROT|nr:FUSC family protein [Acetobacter vaccinii]QEO16498.1 FUSC family protein [Acetobacter vaccinii]